MKCVSSVALVDAGKHVNMGSRRLPGHVWSDWLAGLRALLLIDYI
jgi:hypothetical protein